MVRFNETWASDFSAGAIVTTASEHFGNELDTVQKRQRYGSANSLILANLSAENLLILLDGTRTVGILYASGGSYVLKPEEGIFFDFVKLTNVSATNTSADEIKVRIARADVV